MMLIRHVDKVVMINKVIPDKGIINKMVTDDVDNEMVISPMVITKFVRDDRLIRDLEAVHV